MKTYIALLKGINVGGHRKILMADLRVLLTKLGLENVKTYIQSGNVIFQSEENNTIILEEKISQQIKKQYNFEVPIIIKTKDDIETILNHCPFSEDQKMATYFFMLSAIPKDDLVKEASEKHYENETYKIIDDCLYYYSAKGIGKAKFNINYFEKKLSVIATARNFKTMCKLLSLSQVNE